MIPQRRKQVVRIFVAMLFLLGVALIYLLLFNAGLNISERVTTTYGTDIPVAGEREIAVQNVGDHIIYNIVVSYEWKNYGKTKILDIERLEPGQEFIVDYFFPEELEQVNLIVEAPFHQSVEKVVAARKSSVELSYEFSMQQFAFLEQPYSFSMKVCNSGPATSGIVIEERHSSGFFEEENITGSYDFRGNECKTIKYTLTPKTAGSTKINFLIRAGENEERLQRDVEVQD